MAWLHTKGLTRRLFALAAMLLITQSAVTPHQAARAQASSPEQDVQTYLPLISSRQSPPTADWYMAGANPQRTSWVSEEIKGDLAVEWYRPIEPYIPAKNQVIAADDTIFVATAKGLFAFDTLGSQKWVFATAMPLGNSPTVVDGVAYVGGLDSKIYAINSKDGSLAWSYQALGDDGIGGGFDTNPLIIGDKLYAGNKDGYMYAIYIGGSGSSAGTLAWRYKTEGPIHFSAAASKDNSTIFFASDDVHAYALKAQDGALVWKSAKLPSAGFHSWWPVVAGGQVILSAARPYRFNTPPQGDNTTYSTGEPPMIDHTPWPPVYDAFTKQNSDGTWDAGKVLGYFQSQPTMRNYYLLNAGDGREMAVAPFTHVGTKSGNHFPVGIAADGTIYALTNRSAEKYNQGIAGWSVGISYITASTPGFTAYDEPAGFALGGNVAYYVQCCDRAGGAVNLATGAGYRYYSYDLPDLAPGYNKSYSGTTEANAVMVYGGWNGVYGGHGDQSPPIPYRGKVYMIRSNTLMAWSSKGGADLLPESTVAAASATKSVAVQTLTARLEQEVIKILDAGHLRPGFGIEGIFSLAGKSEVGDNLSDYFSAPADTFLALSRAYPYLSPGTQARAKIYLANEYANYSPCRFTHMGWGGAGREWFDLPPEVQAAAGGGPYITYGFKGWANDEFQPHSFYALWQYVKNVEPGRAAGIFDDCRPKLKTPPGAAVLAEYPFAHNAWIAGYKGYVELAKLAGKSAEANAKQATLDQLLAARAANFTKDNPWGPDAHNYGQCFSVARNFVNLTPELGAALRNEPSAYAKVQAALNEYVHDAPYWFANHFEATCIEGVMHHSYDYAGIFAAKAFIAQAPREELAKHLDVPAFKVGDLFFIQNLVATIEGPTSTAVATSHS